MSISGRGRDALQNGIGSERPAESEYAEFYQGYVASLPQDDVLKLMEGQLEELRAIPFRVGTDREQYRYAPEKWSIREVVGHLIDAERVFGYRASCISRGDSTPLPGFDENEYVSSSGNHERPLATLVDELVALREANILLFRNLPPGSSTRIGNANGSPVSVRALAWIITGHVEHHFGVLRERYGVTSIRRASSSS